MKYTVDAAISAFTCICIGLFAALFISYGQAQLPQVTVVGSVTSGHCTGFLSTLQLQDSGLGCPGTGALTVGGHLGFIVGPAPTNNACTGFALATGAQDSAGKLTYTSATTCAINFGAAYANPPACIVAPGTAASTVLVTTTTTVMSVTFGTAQAAMAWQCEGI